MTQLDEERLGALLSAYLDGELDAAQAESVERVVANDPHAQRLLHELRLTTESISRLPRHVAPSSVLDDLELRLEREQLLEEPRGGYSGPHPRRTGLWQWLSMAAVVGISVLGGTWALLGGRDSPRGVGHGIVAQGPSRQEPARRDGLEMPEPGDRPSEEAPGTARTRQRLRRAGDVEGVEGSLQLADLSKTKAELDAKVATRERADAPPATAPPREPPVSVPYRGSSEPSVGLLHADAVLRLRVTASDEARRQDVLTTLGSTLDAYVVREPEGVGLGTEAQGPAARNAFRGTSVVDSADKSGPRRILVRLPAARVDAIVEELGRQCGDEYVTLSAGPLVFEGWRQTRYALGRITRPADEAGAYVPATEQLAAGDYRFRGGAQSEFAARPAEAEESTESTSWLDLALDTIGVKGDGSTRRAPDRTAAGEPAMKNGSDDDEPGTTRRLASIGQSSVPGAPFENEAGSTAATMVENAGHVAEGPPAPMLAGDDGTLNKQPAQDLEPRLVERRMQALRAQGTSPPAPSRDGNAQAAAPIGGSRANGDWYVTLVIDVDVRKPTPPRRPSTPSRDSRTPRRAPSPDKPNR